MRRRTARRPWLAAWRCAAGHVHIHAASGCPACGGALRAVAIRPEARLIAMTTVRVTPDGTPFRLGVAVTRAGNARTLCIVVGAVRGTGRDAVLLREENGSIIARPRGARHDD
ncbi:MAG TPA: hypothetical protein VFX92_02135 [Candidatus Krumholzibacteria bacterium]|nr:hypothetical protein [Candidatus Krumholzibacteria bacterium]